MSFPSRARIERTVLRQMRRRKNEYGTYWAFKGRIGGCSIKAYSAWPPTLIAKVTECLVWEWDSHDRWSE